MIQVLNIDPFQDEFVHNRHSFEMGLTRSIGFCGSTCSRYHWNMFLPFAITTFS